MGVPAKKRVYVGDASKRIRVKMPRTLAAALKCLRQVYGVDKVQLWLDPRHGGRKPGRGMELVEDEQDYRAVVDNDTLVFVAGDQVLQPTAQLLAAFEGQTIYATDYVAYPARPAAPEVRGPAKQYALPTFEVPDLYNTTYGRDFVPRARLPESNLDCAPSSSKAEDAAAALPVFGPALPETSHRRDYQAYPIRAVNGRHFDDPFARRPGSAPATRRTSTTYKDDFKGCPILDREIPRNKARMDLPPGAQRPGTTYQTAYHGRHPPPQPLFDNYAAIGNGSLDWQVVAPAMPNAYKTTYMREYLEWDLPNAMLNMEPCEKVLVQKKQHRGNKSGHAPKSRNTAA